MKWQKRKREGKGFDSGEGPAGSWVRSPVEKRSLLSVEEKESADEREERKKMPVGWGK